MSGDFGILHSPLDNLNISVWYSPAAAFMADTH